MREEHKIVLVFIIAVLGIFATGILLEGCPSDPVPPTGSECQRVEDISQNCFTCASTPVCHWCASPDPSVQGCYARSRPLDCGGEVVRISDLCNSLDEGLDGVDDESPDE